MYLFKVTAPLTIRLPDGRKHLMVERFPHPQGLLYFEPFWEPPEHGVHLIRGALKGDGPWKIGDCVITVTGCQGADPQLAMEWSAWQEHLAVTGGEYVPREEVVALARGLGALI